MKISEILKNKVTISFEVFPPKKSSEDVEALFKAIDELVEVKPDFISVTYGSGGSTIKNTVEIAEYIQKKEGIEALAHLTGGPSNKKAINEVCEGLKKANIENILSLRGDMPVNGCENFCEEFPHASDLNEYIKKEYDGYFCIGGGCYPEVHSEAENMKEDLINLKKKQDSGAEFAITQIFLDNNYFYRFIREARAIGITIPIIAGIMPVFNAKQIKRMASSCGCTIPLTIRTMIDKYSDDKEAMREIGISYAVSQIIDLLSNGVDGIHIYTMNKAKNAKDILAAIHNVIQREFKK